MRRFLIALPISMHFSVALRGTMAVGVPLFGLGALGHPTLALLATISALQSTLADVGGSYRGRMLTLLLACLLVPGAAALGSVLMPWWWAVTIGAAVLALTVGLARSLGQLGASLGFATGVAYLIGTALGGGATPTVLILGGMLLGSLWTLLVALALWKLRPYKRLEYEVADCFAAAASLARAAAYLDHIAGEAELTRRHHALRFAVERARSAIGEVSSGTDGRSLTLPRLLVLVRSAARVGANAVTLADIRLSDNQEPQGVQTVYAKATNALVDVSRNIAYQLNRGRGELDLRPLEQALAALRATLARIHIQPEAPDALLVNLQHAVGVLDRALLHLRNAAEVLGQLFGAQHHQGNRLLPRFYIRDLLRRGRQALRTNLDSRSLIFRHALRLGLAVGVATACYSVLHLPHGLWIPLSIMVVLQPDFGGTRMRSGQRTAGTVAGVAVAGVLIALIHDRLLIELLLLPLIFFTLLFLRSRYTLGVTLLTPFVILLLDLLVPGNYMTILERVADTVAGAALALLAGYWLWPSWQRERLAIQIARALQANRDYAQGIFDRLLAGGEFDQPAHDLRRLAELEAANTEAGYQNLLAEPAHTRGNVTAAMTLTSYNERLTRHLTSLGEHLGTPLAAIPPETFARWADQLRRALDDIAAIVANGLPMRPELNAFEAADAALRESPVSDDWHAKQQRLLIEPLLQKVTTDVSALYAGALRLQSVSHLPASVKNAAR